jgi:hypothetical protein
VNVVRHKAPCPYLDMAFAAPFSQQIKIGKVILIAEKGHLPAVATLGDVVRDARGYYSCYSCHSGKISESYILSINILSPEFPHCPRNSPRDVKFMAGVGD